MLKFRIIISLIFISLIIFSCKIRKQNNLTKGEISQLQSLLNKGKTIRLSDNVYDLKGTQLLVKAKIIFDDKAKIINGTLVGDGGVLECPDRQCFEKVVLKGNWKNKVGKLEWFTNGKDENQNFIALTNVVSMNAVVKLGAIYPIAPPTNGSFNSPNDIIIKGTSPQKSGFILRSKPKVGQAYFRTEKGNNIQFENISIVTQDFINRKRPQGKDYVFASCSYSSLYRNAKPDLSFFRLKNCTLQGSINFDYAASPRNVTSERFLQLGIDNVQIQNCKIEGAVTTLQLSNGAYQEVEINSNTITNILGPVFFFPAGGIEPSLSVKLVNEKRRIMRIQNNTVRNDHPVAGVANGYMSLVVAKGKDFEVTNNTIENILNTKNGIETIPFYCSAMNYLLVKNNKILNVGSKGVGTGFGGNCLLKLKGAVNCDIIDNEFRFTKMGLVDLGVIPSENSSLRNIRPTQFRFSLMGANLHKGRVKDNFYNIQGNTFSAAFISDYSFLSRKKVNMENNNYLINNFGKSDPNNWGGNLQVFDYTLFYMREAVSDGELIVKNNMIEIKNIDGKTFHFTYDLNDNKDFKKVIYQNNTFRTDAIVSLAYPRTEMLMSKNELKGKGSFAYSNAASTKPNRSIKELVTEQRVEEYEANRTGAYHLKNFGSSTISTKNNTDSIANIIRLNFNDLHFYEGNDQLPITLDINAKVKTNQNKNLNLNYRVVFSKGNQIHFFDQETNKIIRTTPFWFAGKPEFCHDIKLLSASKDDKIKLSLTSSSRWRSRNKTGYIILRGLENVKEFEIKASVQKLKFPPNIKGAQYVNKVISKW